MYPIQAPENVSRQVNRGFLLPVGVNVITKILDQFRNEMCAWGRVPATANLDPGRAKITSVRTDAVEGYSMQVKQLGRPEFE
jgi:hypothetical protein